MLHCVAPLKLKSYKQTEMYGCLMIHNDYVCTMCAQDFTRKSSANRHNTNLHQGRAVIVRFVEYIVGRVSGIYQATDPRQYRRKAKKNSCFPAGVGYSKTAPASFADTVEGFMDSNGFRNQNSGQPINFQSITTTPPPAMIHNPIIESFIRRYEEDKLQERIIKCEERQKAGTREAFDNLIRAINLSRIQNKEGVAADPSSQIPDLVAAGILVPISFIDANGNPAIRYEHHSLATAPMAPQNGCGGLTFADMLKIIETAYRRSNEFVMKFIEARGGEEDHLRGIEREKELSDSISPPKTTNIGAQRLKPEEHRIVDDSHAPRKEEREKSRNGQEQEMKQRYRTMGQEQEDTLFMTISDMRNNRLPPFGSIFRGQAVEFQMPASVRELFGRLIRKAGQPQRQYGPDYDSTAQQDLANHERKVRDQVNEVQRMQEAAIRERQKSNSRRRTLC
jgi:hypothetical protein